LPPFFRDAKKCHAGASAKADKTAHPTDSKVTSEKAQDPVAPRETNEISAAKAAAQASSAYLNYATDTYPKKDKALPEKGQEGSIEPAFTSSHKRRVPLRSKSVTIRPVVNPTGSVSYRVLGTIRPKTPQRKQFSAAWTTPLRPRPQPSPKSNDIREPSVESTTLAGS
jgi:hypothetical protein